MPKQRCKELKLVEEAMEAAEKQLRRYAKALRENDAANLRLRLYTVDRIRLGKADMAAGSFSYAKA